MKAALPNKTYLASCLRHFAQIQSDGWTLDTLGMLYGNPSTLLKKKIFIWFNYIDEKLEVD